MLGLIQGALNLANRLGVFLTLKKNDKHEIMEWYFKHRKKILIATIGYVIFRFVYLSL